MKITHSKEQVSFFITQVPDSPDDDLSPRETSQFTFHSN